MKKNQVVDNNYHISAYAHICPNAGLAGEDVVGKTSSDGIGSSVITQILLLECQ